MRTAYWLTLLLSLSFTDVAECQTAEQFPNGGFFGGWFDRVSRTQAEQPHWLAPIFTATPRLEEMYVYDIARQNAAKGDVTTFGGTKGLLLIPSEHINIVMTPPSYLMHESARVHDGFGDAAFLLKYRLAASNEEGGNYVVTAFVGATIPTGSYTNGARSAVVTPTIGVGKGWGNFDIQSTVGVGILVSDLNTLGTTVFVQYRVPIQSNQEAVA